VDTPNGVELFAQYAARVVQRYPYVRKVICCEPELLRDRAVGLLDIADERDLHIWRALGTCLLGAAKTGLGRSEEGLAEIRDGIALYQGLRTPPVFWPLILFVRAGACARSGRPAEGLGLIEEAIEIADQGSGLTLLPEFYSLKGDLLLLIPPAKGSNAEPWFQRAFDTARGLDARMTQLRAAIGLCRSQRDRGDAQQGSEEVLKGCHVPPRLLRPRAAWKIAVCID
jgi:hypothetical protein